MKFRKIFLYKRIQIHNQDILNLNSNFQFENGLTYGFIFSEWQIVTVSFVNCNFPITIPRIQLIIETHKLLILSVYVCVQKFICIFVCM